MTELEAFYFAFGSDPEPECDGAGRDTFAAIMREAKAEKQAKRGLRVIGR
jgi:hypothetical protein